MLRKLAYENLPVPYDRVSQTAERSRSRGRLMGGAMLTLNNALVDKAFLKNDYAPGFRPLEIAEAKTKNWSISKFTVDERDVGLMNLRAIRDGFPHRIIPPGTYTKLRHHTRGIVMSDTPAESWENEIALKQARGTTLVAGLGLGFLLEAILRAGRVRDVLVIEIDPEVITMVGPRFASDDRVRIVRGDFRKLDPTRPPKRIFGRGLPHIDFAWVDIWDKACVTNLDEMVDVRNRWAPHVRRMEFWCERELWRSDGPF